MERWLNQEIQEKIKDYNNCTIKNPFKGTAYVNKTKKQDREKIRTNKENKQKISSIVNTVDREIKKLLFC